MHFSTGLWSFYKLRSKKSGLNIWVHIPIHLYEYTSRYDTVSYSNLATMILARWLSQFISNTHTGKPLVGISLGSISDSNIAEKKSGVIIWVEEEHGNHVR